MDETTIQKYFKKAGFLDTLSISIDNDDISLNDVQMTGYVCM